MNPSKLMKTVAARIRRMPLLPRKRGSVLILVVALLVLMALIGTAFMTTARTDVYSATQHGYNTQIDLLVDGIVSVSQDALVKDLMQAGTNYRAAGYEDWDSADNDWFLAERYPILGQTNLPTWRRISVSPIAGTNFQKMFESPIQGDQPWGVRDNLVPTSRKITLPSGQQVEWPAFQVPGVGTPVLAADADGDGIADAGLFRLPVGQVNGVTYYAAIRIIDNGAAINASMAMKPLKTDPSAAGNNEFSGSVRADMFGTNIDLNGLLINPAELQKLHGYRISGQTNATQTFTGPADVTMLPTLRASNDFQFASTYEAVWAHLGSRLGNPRDSGLPPGGTVSKYFALPTGDAISLAYHFCLVNPDASPSVVELCMPQSVGTPVNAVGSTPVNRPSFPPEQVSQWYTALFDTSIKRQARPFLVARNPVSNQSPDLFPKKASIAEAAQSGKFGDRAYDPNTQRTFVVLEAKPRGTPNRDAATSLPGWGIMPWTAHPAKISVNTGTFPQLWVAYWAAMSKAEAQAGGGGGGNSPPGRYFRSPVHEAAAPAIPIPAMRQLRAAKAAVNTIDMRDDNQDVTSRTITVSSGDSNLFTVNVYGCEAQPFITGAIVHRYPEGRNPNAPPTDPTQPPAPTDAYVAIELYNPHPFPISIRPFRIGFRSKGGAITGSTKVTDMTKTDSLPGPDQIDAFGRLIIESSAANRPKDLKFDQDPKPKTRDHAPLLTDFMRSTYLNPKEVYLLRTRRADGTETVGPSVWNAFNEKDQPNDLIPLDQLDFSGIESPYYDETSGQITEGRLHYGRATARSSDENSAAWHCVYPYPDGEAGNPNAYNYRDVARLSLAKEQYLRSGWKEEKKTDQGYPTRGFVGLDKAKADATYKTRPLQIAALDTAGPYNPVPAPPPAGPTGTRIHPFGTFARNGDILDVPFVGGHAIKAYSREDVTGDAISKKGIVSMASVTVDALYAEDGTLGNSEKENVGRFCPIEGDATYDFAYDLFDYLDVFSPQQDFLPNVDPGEYDDGDPAQRSPSPREAWPSGGAEVVRNDPGSGPVTEIIGREDHSPVDGRVNINTANARVLAAVPWFGDNPTANAQVAQMIVAYRDGNGGTGGAGPFKSVLEINKVPGFKTMRFRGNSLGAVDLKKDDPNLNDGDFSPYFPTQPNETDRVYGDYEAEFVNFKRVSNLITTRSDSFTAYVVVQGWRNAGTANPELVVQRRRAYIADRSAIRPNLPNAARPNQSLLTTMDLINVPNN